jgi:hypothetical protein
MGYDDHGLTNSRCDQTVDVRLLSPGIYPGPKCFENGGSDLKSRTSTELLK